MPNWSQRGSGETSLNPVREIGPDAVNDRSHLPLADSNSTGPTTEVPLSRPGIHRRLYDWVLHWSETPYGVPALFTLAFAESSIFPLPPDLLLLALGLARPRRAFWYATVCSIGSVLGGIAGYAIGYFVWEAVQDLFFAYIPGFTREGFASVQMLYNEYGFLAVLIAGFTPIPYKIFTIASGVFAMNIPLFILASGFSRTARFFLEGGLLFWCGRGIQRLIDRYFNLFSILFVVLLIGGFVIVRWLR
ncbi:MAG: YqaA family protein [Candidatus Binatia bacterium]